MINKGLILKTAAVVSAVSVLIITGCQGGNKETTAVKIKSEIKETSVVSEKDREEDIETVVRSNGSSGQDTEDLRNDSEREAASDRRVPEVTVEVKQPKDESGDAGEEDRGTDSSSTSPGAGEGSADDSAVSSISDMESADSSAGWDGGMENDSAVSEYSESGYTEQYEYDSNEQYGDYEYTDENAGAVEGGEGSAEPLPEPEVPVQEYEEPGESLTYLDTYVATAYCSCPTCTGPYSSGYTASGTLATEGRTIACNTLPFGTQVYIECGEYSGYYIVEDTGWSPYGDAWLDFFFESHDSALAFGLRYADVYLVN